MAAKFNELPVPKAIDRSAGVNTSLEEKSLEAGSPKSKEAKPRKKGRGRPKKAERVELAPLGVSTTQETFGWIEAISTRAVKEVIGQPNGLKRAKSMTKVAVVRAALKNLAKLSDSELAELIENSGH